MFATDRSKTHPVALILELVDTPVDLRAINRFNLLLHQRQRQRPRRSVVSYIEWPKHLGNFRSL